MSTRQLAAEDGNYEKEDAVVRTTLDDAEVDLNMQNTFRMPRMRSKTCMRYTTVEH